MMNRERVAALSLDPWPSVLFWSAERCGKPSPLDALGIPKVGESERMIGGPRSPESSVWRGVSWHCRPSERLRCWGL
jgi:hypothetical protein